MSYHYKCTRLNLNWSLETKEERSAFISKYLESIPFAPNENELEMMGRYILWGKTPETGLNGRQEGLELETSRGTWDSSPTESLDALLESPTFTESILHKPEDPTFKAPKFKFSRAEARQNSSPSLLADFEALWRSIDETELLISFYELSHQKRTKPIRQELLNRFTPSELSSIEALSSHLNSYQYLSKKHDLVELREQQYTLRDSYASPILSQPTWTQSEPPTTFWDLDIQVYPLGIYSKNNPLSSKLFSAFPSPSSFSDSELTELSSLLWRKYDSSLLTFDFTNPSHLAQLDKFYSQAQEIISAADYRDIDSNLHNLIFTYDFYCSLTPLKDFQRDILTLKRLQIPNEDIAREINSKYNHNYTTNYISTLYHKSILGAIADTARLHREVCENLFFPENFKSCIDCGKTLLKSTENFMRKAKVKDGFDCRCKACAKILREKRS